MHLREFPTFSHHPLLQRLVIYDYEMTRYDFLNVLCSASLKLQGYLHVLSLLCPVVYTAYNIIKTLPPRPYNFQFANFSLTVRIDFGVARRLVISSTPGRLNCRASQKQSLEYMLLRGLRLLMPFTNPPKVAGGHGAPLGEGKRLVAAPRRLVCRRPRHPPAGLWLIAVTYLWALSEERAGELAHSIPARQSSLIKN